MPHRDRETRRLPPNVADAREVEMGRFIDALKAGAKSYNEPRLYVVAGRPVRCPHCGEAEFVPGGRALLNTRVRSVFNVDWADPSAFVLTCAECGRIEWYAHEPEEVVR
jgi:predicted nucleic-acid-binding Zn-ribbon protein